MLSENDPEASIMKECKMEDTLWCLVILDYILKKLEEFQMKWNTEAVWKYTITTRNMPFLVFNLIIIQASWLEDDCKGGGGAENMRERKNVREGKRENTTNR